MQIAREINVLPLMLESLCGLTRFESSASRALAWLTLVLNHPATTQETRDMAVKLVDQFKDSASPSDVESSMALGAALNLETLVDDLLRNTA